MTLSNENTASGVIERAIEDWLTRASERGYQTAFCHLLNAMGYTVVHSTTHGPAEEGKDVVAWDPAGKPSAFQLKRGNINVGCWRAIRSEIAELVEYPINHPSIPTRRRHRSILVTTGYINENASSRINADKSNWRRRGFPALETWAGSQLLAEFQRYAGAFLPQPIPEFHRLLGFMIADGRPLLDKHEFHQLLMSVLPLGAGSPSMTRAEAGRAIRAVAVIGEYAMAGFDRAENHFAMVEAYTMLACYIWATALRLKLSTAVSQDTIRLLEIAIDRSVALIAVAAREYLDSGDVDPWTESVVRRYRASLIGGVLAAHLLWYFLGGRSEWLERDKDDVVHLLVRCLELSALPSEYFVPHTYLMTEALRYNGRVGLGEHAFLRVLNASIMRKQDRPDTVPLWDPYLDPEEAVFRHEGRRTPESEKDVWQEISYTAWPLILVAARRNARQFLSGLWHPITALHFHEPVPARTYQRLLWCFSDGRMRFHMVPRPSSWATLRRESIKPGNMVHPFKRAPHWLPYYLCVYPQRFHAAAVLSLDDALCARL